MQKLEEFGEKLKAHQVRLDSLMSEIPEIDGFPCKYYLFLTRLKGFTRPFTGLFDRLLEKEARQSDVFDLFRADLREHIYVDDAIRQGVAFRRPLRNIVSSFDWVHLALREFIFVFGDPIDHKLLFNDWKARTTPEAFMEAARIMVSDLLRSLVVHAIQTQQLTGDYPTSDEALSYVIDLLRKGIFTAYKKDKRSWSKISEHLDSIDVALDDYATDYKKFNGMLMRFERAEGQPFSDEIKVLLKYYQLRGEVSHPANETPKFYQCGLELEFQTPLRHGNLEMFARRIRQETGMYALSTTASEEAFTNPHGGVLTGDDSLPTLPGYFPSEYASAVMKTKEDEENLAKLLRFINQRGCLIDESAGIHIHVSRDGCSIENLQNLVLRFARMEKLIRQCSFNEERAHDFNMYGPSLLSLYGDVSTAFMRTKNYLMMTYFVRNSDDIDHLFDASSCSGRYASLFMKTKLGTMEFRGHPATTSVKRIMNYFELTQALVDGAIRNDKQILPIHRLRMAVQLRKNDKTKCLPDPLYAVCSYNKFDAADIPSLNVRNLVKQRFQRVVKKTMQSKKEPEPEHNYDGQLSHHNKTEENNDIN